MTESARVKELEDEVERGKHLNRVLIADRDLQRIQISSLADQLIACQHAHTTDSHLLKASLKHAMELTLDRDAQAALVERMRAAIKKYSSDDALTELAELPASSALQEFKERCWRTGIEAVIDVWLGKPFVKADRDLADKLVAELKGSGK